MFFSIVKKEFKVLFSDLGGLIFLFVLPIIFIVVMNLALGGLYKQDESSVVNLPLLDQDQTARTEILIEQLKQVSGFNIETEIEEEPVTRQKIDDLISNHNRQAAVVFPQGFTQALEQQKASPAQLVVDPATSDQVKIPIQATLQGVIGQVLSQDRLQAGIEDYLQQIPPEYSSLVDAQEIQQSISAQGQEELVKIEQVYPAGIELTESPTASQQHVPGYAVMFVFFIMTALVETVIDERVTGTWKRVVASPAAKTKIILGKFVPYYCVNILQIVVMLSIGALFYDMGIGSSWLGLLLVTLALPLVSVSLGLFIASVVKSKNQGTSIAVITTLILSAFGGIFIPLFVLPSWMQKVAKYTPTGTALEGFQDVIVRQLGVSAVLDNIIILAVFAVIFFILSTVFIKFEEK